MPREKNVYVAAAVVAAMLCYFLALVCSEPLQPSICDGPLLSTSDFPVMHVFSGQFLALHAHCVRTAWAPCPSPWKSVVQFFPSLLRIVAEFFPGGIFPDKNFPVLNPPPPPCNCTLPFVFWELILASILKAFKHDFLQCFPSLVLHGAP